MNKELIMKMIEKAKDSSENAYCPYSNTPFGCSLLVEENIIFGGCNIENATLGCSMEAAEVAIMKAISEGYSKFSSICFWAEKDLPYPSGKIRQILYEFSHSNPNPVQVIVASEDNYALHQFFELFPFPPSPVEV